MGSRKRLASEARKEANKSLYFAKLNDCPISPRKMRLVVDLVRGLDVEKALAVLKFTNRDAAPRLRKLLLSCIANWEQKTGKSADTGNLFVKTVFVTPGPTAKRMRPAPQGRGHRIRKRSNHVTLFIDSRETINLEN